MRPRKPETFISLPSNIMYIFGDVFAYGVVAVEKNLGNITMELTEEEIIALRLEASRVLGITESEAGRELNEFGLDSLKVILSFANSAQQLRTWMIDIGKEIAETEDDAVTKRNIDNMYKVGAIATCLTLVSFPPDMRDKISEKALTFANAQNKKIDKKYKDLVKADETGDSDRLDSLLDELGSKEEED